MARVSREGVARNNDGPDSGTGVDAADRHWVGGLRRYAASPEVGELGVCWLADPVARHTIFGGNVQGVATDASRLEGFTRNGESILSIFCRLAVVRGRQRMERGLRSRVAVGEGR